MSYSSSNTTILFLTLAILLQTSLGLDPNPVFYGCSNSQNFTSNSPYYSNLKSLITFLTYKTPSTGFALASIDQFHNQTAYGLSLCRGDVSSSECKTCVSEAARQILKLCPSNKGGMIYYDNCMLKYLDQDFFGLIDNTNLFNLVNVHNVSNPEAFNYKTKELFTQLVQKASESPKMYAGGAVKVSELNVTVYGLTQCTRDLSDYDCNKCLNDAITQLPISNCCDAKQGARIVRGSCNVRYEIYPFLKYYN